MNPIQVMEEDEEEEVEQIIVEAAIEEECNESNINDICGLWDVYSKYQFRAYIHGCIMFSLYSKEVDEELHFLRDIRDLL